MSNVVPEVLRLKVGDEDHSLRYRFKRTGH